MDGTPLPLLPLENQTLKDTFRVPPFSSVTVAYRFHGTHLGRFLVHCHLLEHEDHSMMRYGVEVCVDG